MAETTLPRATQDIDLLNVFVETSDFDRVAATLAQPGVDVSADCAALDRDGRYRAKDWPDIEQIVLTMPDLDEREVIDWLTRMIGEDDERTLRFLGLASS